MQDKTAYIRPKVVRPFFKPHVSGSYVYWAVVVDSFFGKQYGKRKKVVAIDGHKCG
jgi:hypothetical protein